MHPRLGAKTRRAGRRLGNVEDTEALLGHRSGSAPLGTAGRCDVGGAAPEVTGFTRLGPGFTGWFFVRVKNLSIAEAVRGPAICGSRWRLQCVEVQEQRPSSKHSAPILMYGSWWINLQSALSSNCTECRGCIISQL